MLRFVSALPRYHIFKARNAPSKKLTIIAGKVGVTRALEGRLPKHYVVVRPAKGQHWLPVTGVSAGAGGPDQDGERGCREDLELEETCDSRSSLILRSELATASQAFPGSAPDRRRTFPV